MTFLRSQYVLDDSDLKKKIPDYNYYTFLLQIIGFFVFKTGSVCVCVCVFEGAEKRKFGVRKFKKKFFVK